VVKRDLDQLYESLIHRKYTLSQLRKILGDWLKEESIGDDTFLHFVGKGERDSGDHEKGDFEAFLEKNFSHLTPLYQEAGHIPFIKATITVHWASHYDLSRRELPEIFPFLERGRNEETDEWIGHLEELGRTLYKEKRVLFESCVSEIEEDSPLIQSLWTRLSSLSPAQVFKKEPIFALLLKEAFERIFCGESRETDVKELISEPAFPVSSEDSRFLQRRGEMIKALKTFHLFKEKKAVLDIAKDSPPETLKKWESFYIQTLSSLPFLKEKLHDDLRRFGLSIPPFLQEEERALFLQVQKMAEGFSAFYGPALAEWEQGQSTSPTMIQDIPYILSKKRPIPDHHRVCYILMDGMRWDLWEHLKSEFFGKMPNLFRFVRQGVLWANQPTNTSSQLAHFEEAFRAAYSDSEDVLFWKISGIDEKVHSEKGPLTHLFANIISYLEIDLLFRLRDLPSRTLLILFSDHGFVENPAFNPKDKYDTPRYIHGKDSPFEVIIPWAWIMRI
jgi:hypothetical protein